MSSHHEQLTTPFEHLTHAFGRGDALISNRTWRGWEWGGGGCTPHYFLSYIYFPPLPYPLLYFFFLYIVFLLFVPVLLYLPLLVLIMFTDTAPPPLQLRLVSVKIRLGGSGHREGGPEAGRRE